jgi:hypothetical protein
MSRSPDLFSEGDVWLQALADRPPAYAPTHGRWSVTWSYIMKMLIAALTSATLIAVPASIEAAAAAPSDSGQWEQNYNGTYNGYPLRDWYRPDSW